MASYKSSHKGSEIDNAVKNANLMLITGDGDPDTTTVGTLGQIYQNTTDGTLFRCSAINGSNYTWTELVDFTAAKIINTLTETGEGKVLDARQGKTLSDKIGTQTYTEQNYVTDAEPLTASIDKLDMQAKDTADLVSTNVGDLETLTTTDKSSLVNATNEVKNLVDTIPAGPQGPKGDAFKYSDFTAEQLESLTGPQGPQGPPGLSLSLKVNRQYDTYEDLPVSADIGYMCLVGLELHIYTENGWVNAGKLTKIDYDLFMHIEGGLFTDESGVEIGESGLEALQSHIIDANTHDNLIIDGTEV